MVEELFVELNYYRINGSIAGLKNYRNEGLND